MKVSRLLFFLCCLLSIQVQSQLRMPDAYAGSTKYNIIKTWDAQAPVTDPAVVVTKGFKDVKQYVVYHDGLGRAIQSVQRQGSQATGGSAIDLVTPVVYDTYGREAYQFLPFAANNTGGNASLTDGGFKYNAFQQDSTFQKGQFPGETFYYSKKNFEPSPLNRVLENYAVGNSWAGSESAVDPALRRNITTQQRINTVSDSVRIWTVSGSTYATTAMFAANQLMKLITVDEHKKLTVEYKNREGLVLLKKTQILDAPSSGHYGWLCTYYIYDHQNRIRLVVQPRGVELLMANAWNISALSGDILNEQCFKYDYDTKGRMVVNKVPGAAEVRKVYDARDRVILQQDGNLRAANKWIFTKYDLQNRAVMTGLYTNNTYTTQAAMQTFVNSQNLGLYENYPSGSFPYYSLNQSFPVVTDTSWLLTVAWFDDYSWAAGFSGFALKDNGYDNQFPAASNSVWPYPQSITANYIQTQGLATGRWDKSAAYRVESNFYDDWGRIIQTKTSNITGGVDITTTQYSFNGKVLQTHLRHQKLGNNSNTHLVITKHLYDDLWRLLTVKQSISSVVGGVAVSSAEKTIVSNEYNALGQLSKKKLGTKPSTANPLSNHDYEYNIRGWISAINKAYLTAAAADRYFGFQLGFDQNGVLGTFTPQYNLNVSGILWKNEADQQVRKYDFVYDAADRLLSANFNQFVSGSGTSAVFDKSAGLDFSLTSMGYDANGNILSKNQKGWKLGGSSYIDSLKYTYYNSGNRLKNVIDLANDTATKLGDFRSSKAYMIALGNNKTNAATDYTYDANGNIITDRNKDVEDVSLAGIDYNHLNLPVRIRIKNKGTIDYIYDNDGNKIKKTVTEGVTVVSTLYIEGFEYKNDTLQQFQHPEGRVRLEAATVNTCPTLPLRFVYDYYVKDHLTNIRVLLTEDQPADCYIAATVEDARLTSEQVFYNIVPARAITKATTGATQTSFENKLYRTHGGLTNEKTGLAIVLKVMAGDKVAIRAESFYSLPGGNAGSPLTVALTELLTSFVGSSQAALKGISATTDITGISGNPAALNSFMSGNNPATNTAKAAVNWILFDEQFKFVAGDYDGVEASGGYKNHTKFVNAPAQITKSGYLYVFVSNESNLAVYFDNLQLTHTRGAILETTDYYPFGLAMAGTNSKAFKATKTDHRKKFVGQDYESELGWSTYQFKFRTHDPQIGRFLQIDPLAEKFVHNSTYAYAENKVTNAIDLEGLEA